MTAVCEPVPLALATCDAIHIDPGTGKRTLLGLFSTVAARAIPAVVPAMAVYAALTECRGRMPVTVRVIDVEEARPPVAQASVELACDDPLSVAELDARFGSVTFPAAGEYRVQLIAAGTVVTERRLTLAVAIGAKRGGRESV